MRRAGQASGKEARDTGTATYVVRFEKRPRACRPVAEKTALGRIPRVTRLLSLGHRIDDMIRSSEVKDWAEAARLVGVTRARMTQIASLLLLAPEIQEAILNLPPIFRGHDPITEHDLRLVAAHVDWCTQTMVWTPLV